MHDDRVVDATLCLTEMITEYQHGPNATSELRREVRELREDVNRLKGAR